jgi:Domain of unknown function (DUF397)
MEPPASLRWIKASVSAGLNACVELAPQGNMIAMRDSKHPEIALQFSKHEIRDFLDGAKRGEFDPLVRL